MNSHALITAVEDVLTQGLELLEEISDDATYGYMLPAPHLASVGKHYRHVIDHFTCLLRGLRESVIDYDNRSRDLDIESSIDTARHATMALIDEFRSLTAEQISATTKVRYSVGYSEQDTLVLETVVAREIAFCVSHAIHHFAIVRLVCDEFALALPADFGVAPSTLKYRATVHA